MSTFDKFCADLLEESKRFLEKAKELEKTNQPDEDGIKAFQHACLLLGVCSLEAYINGIGEEMSLSEKIPIHVRGILLEKEVRLDKGEFVLSDSLRMSRMTDRIEVLYRKYKGTEIDKSETWWPTIKSGIDLRNKITHPKEVVKISNAFLTKILQAILDCLSVLYWAVYKREFPKANLQLTSRLDF